MVMNAELCHGESILSGPKHPVLFRNHDRSHGPFLGLGVKPEVRGSPGGATGGSKF